MIKDFWTKLKVSPPSASTKGYAAGPGSSRAGEPGWRSLASSRSTSADVSVERGEL